MDGYCILEIAKAISIVLLSAVPVTSVIIIYLNRKHNLDKKQKAFGIGGRVTQFGMSMSLVALALLAIVVEAATWEAIEKLIYALVAFAAGTYVSSRTNFSENREDE